MAQPKLALYDPTGVTLIQTFELDTTPGQPSASYPCRLVNDNSGGVVNPANAPVVSCREVDNITGDAVIRGLAAVEGRWIEFQALGTGSVGDQHIATAWIPLGRGRSLALPALASGGWHDVAWRYNPPYSAPQGSILFIPTAEDNQPFVATDMGHTESSRDGVLNGIGDGYVSELIQGGLITATPVTPDGYVNWNDSLYVFNGVPYALLAGKVAPNNNDVGGHALIVNQAYWGRMSFNATGLNITKSAWFASGSPNIAQVPPTPNGEINLGYFFRDWNGIIHTADITNQQLVGRFAASWVSGLNLLIGPGRGRVDNTLQALQTQSQLSCPNSSTITVWLQSNGSLAFTTDGSRPSSRAYLLCQVPTSPTVVTIASLIDYRDPIGAEVFTIPFYWAGVPTALAKARAVWPHPRTGYIRIPRGLVVACASLGSANTMGQLRVEFKVNGTTIFTSSGTTDRRPELLWNDAATVNEAAFPEVLVIPSYAFLEASIVYPVAFDGTGPNDVILNALIEMP